MLTATDESNFCEHGYLKSRSPDAAKCPECAPRSQSKAAVKSPSKLSEMPSTVRVVVCQKCGLKLRRTRYHTWRPFGGRVPMCEKGQHQWQPVEKQGGHGVDEHHADNVQGDAP